MIGAPLVLALLPKIRITIGHCLGAAFFAAAALSLIWSVSKIDSANFLFLMLGLACVFCAAAEAESLEPVWIALGAGAAINVVVGIAQLGHPDLLPSTGISGLFFQQDFLGGFTAIVLVGLVLGIKNKSDFVWLLIGLDALALLLSHSRGAWLAAALPLFFATARAFLPARALVAFLGAILIAVLLIGIDYFWLHDRNASVIARLGQWDWVTQNLRLFGWGFGTLGSIFSFEHADNDFLELAFDLGLLSLFFWALVAYAIRIKPNASSFVLTAILINALTSAPFHNPATAFIAAVVLGHLCGAGRAVYRPRRAGAVVGEIDFGGELFAPRHI